MTKFIFKRLNAETELIFTKAEGHIGWIHGVDQDGDRMPIASTSPKRKLRVMLGNPGKHYNAQEIIDAYNKGLST